MNQFLLGRVINFTILIFSLMVQGSDGTGVYGADFTSSNLTLSAAQCLKQKYHTDFISVLGYQGDPNHVVENVCQSLRNAKEAGIKSTDVFILPSPNCEGECGPKAQVNEIVEYLSTYCPEYWSGRLWIMVLYQFWGIPIRDIGYKTNRDHMNEYIDVCLDQTQFKFNCGIFTTLTDWYNAFGTLSPVYEYPAEMGLPLWYYPADTAENFDAYNNFAFGGWDKPYSKQVIPSSYYSDYCGLPYLGIDWKE